MSQTDNIFMSVVKLTRELCSQDFNGAQTHVELVDVVLTEVADAYVAVANSEARDWFEFTEQDLQ